MLAKRRVAPAPNVTPERPAYKVGDVLVSVWGATMLMVDFYRVTKVSPSGKTVTFTEIPSITTPGGFLAGTALPDLTAEPKGETYTRRVRPSNGRLYIEAYWRGVGPWDGRAWHYDHCD